MIVLASHPPAQHPYPLCRVPSQLRGAFRNILGYYPDSATTNIRGQRVGGYIGHQWTLVWPWAPERGAVPDLMVAPGPDTPIDHKVTSVLRTNASTPITGSLEVGLSFFSSCSNHVSAAHQRFHAQHQLAGSRARLFPFFLPLWLHLVWDGIIAYLMPQLCGPARTSLLLLPQL